MTDWIPWPNGWTGAGPDYGGMNGHAIPMLLGRLLERSETQGEQLDRIEHQVSTGLQDHHIRLRSLEASKENREYIPRWERVAKRVATWLIPLLVALKTGSIDAAIRLLEALK